MTAVAPGIGITGTEFVYRRSDQLVARVVDARHPRI